MYFIRMVVQYTELVSRTLLQRDEQYAKARGGEIGQVYNLACRMQIWYKELQWIKVKSAVRENTIPNHDPKIEFDARMIVT